MTVNHLMAAICDLGVGEGERTAAALDLVFVLRDGVAAQAFDQIVQVLGVLEGLYIDPERAVGLAAHVAGDLDAFERPLDLGGERLVAQIFDQYLRHMLDGDGALERDPGLGECRITLGKERLVFVEALGGLAGG